MNLSVLRMTSALALVFLLPCLARGGPSRAGILKGALVYIEPMPSGMDGLLAAEIVKLGVPLVITGNRNGADYIIGSLSDPKTSAGQGFDGAIEMIDPQARQIVWMGDAGGAKRRKAPQKLAARLIRKMQKDLFGAPSLSDRVDDILNP
jgi:hypothetical protein